MDYKIHVGFGFHVNCYHSYRGDTNDEFGFGGDIRIIRGIINDLNAFNEAGVPVKGTWDFENYYSLEKILPEYAPDIIDGVRERVKKYGDENIIMGYNNGALSAMTDAEFKSSIELAVTNSKGSGLLDIFGEYAPVVRPQEVMFTPSQVSLYNQLGVKALCLYYSCVPFDAFKTLIPPLKDEYAYNYVNYSYKGESIPVLPTISNVDLIDQGSLKYLVKSLHKKQLTGEIRNDLFIFINMDADAVFWEGLKLPGVLAKIPNLDGIRGLVDEVKSLDYVVFDTPYNYLKTHKPVTEIQFTHDTADGNFTGYSSWAEKPFNRKIWTRLERARAYAALYEEEKNAPSFDERILLLSTTHFGLSSPVLNIVREEKALELSESMVRKELEAAPERDSLTLVNIAKSSLLSAQIEVKEEYLKDISQLKLSGDELISFGAVPTAFHADGSVKALFAIFRFKSVKDEYSLSVEITKAKKAAQKPTELKTDSLSVELNEHGQIKSVFYKDKQIGAEDFIKSFINYDYKKYDFSVRKCESICAAGDVQGISIQGRISLPAELESGSFKLELFTIKHADCVFIKMDVRYPYTEETTAISNENASLGRNCDMKWIEAVSLQIKPQLNDNLTIIKRNYSDDLSSFEVADFWKAVPENRELASFNHQVTNGLIGISDGEKGLIIANAKQLLNSMAHCPMRLKDKNGKPAVAMNPFGTYYGRQRKHPSASGGAVMDAYMMIATQGKSLAPAYNGARECFSLALFGFDSEMPDDTTLSDIKGFAEGAVVLTSKNSPLLPCTADNAGIKKVESKKVAVKGLGIPVNPKSLKVALRVAKRIVKTEIKSAQMK
jgi:hypothetical protein